MYYLRKTFAFCFFFSVLFLSLLFKRCNHSSAHEYNENQLIISNDSKLNTKCDNLCASTNNNIVIEVPPRTISNLKIPDFSLLKCVFSDLYHPRTYCVTLDYDILKLWKVKIVLESRRSPTFLFYSFLNSCW